MALPPDFVGYEPLPQPGAYAFQRRDGNPLVLQGPLAEKLRADLDAARGPDLRVAGPGGGRNVIQPGSPQAAALQASVDAAKPPAPTVGVGQVAPGSRTVDRNAQQQAAAADAAARQRAAQAANDADWAKRDAAAQAAKAEAPAAPGPAQAAKESAAPAGPRVVARGKDGSQYYRDENGMLMKVRQGSAGESQAAQARKAGQGTLTPQSAETIREGGEAFDPSYIPERERISNEQRQLNAQVAQRQSAAAAAETLAFAEDAARAKTRAELEGKVAEEAQADAKQAEIEYDTARQTFRDSKVDPNRMFHGPLGSFKLIGSAIAQALGAYGATLGRTQNFAQQIVQSAIDRDIAAQQETIRIRGMDADNALARLTRKLGNQKAAEAVLRSSQGEYAASLYKARAAASKRPEIMEAAQKWDLEEQQRQVELRRQYLQSVQGKVTEKALGKYAYPTSGTPGYSGPATFEEQAAYESLQGKRLDNEGTAQKIAAAEGGGDVSDAQVKAFNDNLMAIDSGDADLQKYAASIGAKRNPETGKWEGDVGGVWRTGVGASDRSQDIAAQSSSLAPGIARALEGGSAPNADNIKRYEEELTSVSGDKMLATLNAFQQRIDSQRAAAEAAVPPSVLEQRKRRLQQGNVRRAEASAPGTALPAPRVVNPR